MMKTMIHLVILSIFASFTVEAILPMPPTGCEDSPFVFRCAALAGQLHCSSPYHKGYMELFCKKTCGFCPNVNKQLIGCFDSPGRVPTKLKELLFTERDSSSKVWNGIRLDWDNWDAYMKALINRCALKAKSNGYKVFGIRYYAECWGSPDITDASTAFGSSMKNPTKCVKEGYKSCKNGDGRCIGKNHGIAVYQI